MRYRVIVSPKAEKNLCSLPPANVKRLAELLDVLKIKPIPAEQFDIKKLRGFKNAYRVRLGQFRVIYTVRWDENLVVILKIEPRERAYR